MIIAASSLLVMYICSDVCVCVCMLVCLIHLCLSIVHVSSSYNPRSHSRLYGRQRWTDAVEHRLGSSLCRGNVRQVNTRTSAIVVVTADLPTLPWWSCGCQRILANITETNAVQCLLCTCASIWWVSVKQVNKTLLYWIFWAYWSSWHVANMIEEWCRLLPNYFGPCCDLTATFTAFILLSKSVYVFAPWRVRVGLGIVSFSYG